MFRILEPGDPHGRMIIAKSIGHPSRIVLLVKGEEPGVGAFVTRASEAASQPWRDVIWIRDPELIENSEATPFFEDAGDGFDAPMLGFDDEVFARVSMDANTYRIDRTYLDAEAKG